MAISAAAVAKAAAAVLSNEKTRKGVGWLLVIVLSPVIVVIAAIGGALSGASQHNADTVALAFSSAPISVSTPADYQAHIRSMRSAFTELDSAVDGLEAQADGAAIDRTRVKSVFYSLYFGADPTAADTAAFADCFVRWEERTRLVDVPAESEDEEPTYVEEIYTAAVPLTDMGAVYANIASRTGMSVTSDVMANATEIYYRVLYGAPAPTYGNEFDDWLAGLPLSTAPFIGADGFCSPLGEGWRGMVTSEFGSRRDPFTGETRGHMGLDMGAPVGTQIRAALPGTVVFVRYSTTGYGYHVMLDHGGGFTTLYAHCSAILVSEGQAVNAGDVIAEVGSTGRSTGPHLHFEVMINGEKQNPRSYLP
jgi:hypothetical protein